MVNDKANSSWRDIPTRDEALRLIKTEYEQAKAKAIADLVNGDGDVLAYIAAGFKADLQRTWSLEDLDFIYGTSEVKPLGLLRGFSPLDKDKGWIAPDPDDKPPPLECKGFNCGAIDDEGNE